MNPPGEPPDRRGLASLYHGLQFAVTTLLGLAAGHWLDRRFGTSPFGTLGGLFGGAALGMYYLARALK